jgi:cytochrome c553
MDCHEGADFAGLSEDDIAGKVKAHVSGEKKHPKAGNEVAEADIADIAAYWAAEGAKAE